MRKPCNFPFLSAALPVCLLLLSGIFLWPSCSRKTSAPPAVPEVTAAPPARKMVLPAWPDMSEMPEIADMPPTGMVAALVRTPCFGSCPAYEVQVRADGTVFWKGDKNVTRLGSYRATASVAWMEALMLFADQHAFFQMSGQYPAGGRDIPDLPQTISYLKNGDREKSIKNGGDAPPALRQFERYFEEKLEELAWEKVSR